LDVKSRPFFLLIFGLPNTMPNRTVNISVISWEAK
jgi:hypothetical protein